MTLLADKVTKAKPKSLLYRCAQVQIDLAYVDISDKMLDAKTCEEWDHWAAEWWALSLIRISMRTRLI